MAKKPGRRRRNKKDVILDFSKRVISKSSKQSNTAAGAVAGSSKQAKKRTKATKEKLSIPTGSKDYEGNIALPDQVAQREFESTGQFFRRLDRLVAKAKVEANMEARFDMTLTGNPNDQAEAKAAMKRKIKEDALIEAKLSKHKRAKRKRGR